MKAEELAQRLEAQVQVGGGDLSELLEAAAELRRLAAIKQSAEPVGWMTETEDGKTMLWTDFSEALTYCDDGEQPIPLYTHPAPRKPMTKEQEEQGWVDECDIGGIKGETAFRQGVRFAERFHQIKE